MRRAFAAAVVTAAILTCATATATAAITAHGSVEQAECAGRVSLRRQRVGARKAILLRFRLRAQRPGREQKNDECPAHRGIVRAREVALSRDRL